MKFSHLNQEGKASMVDISPKEIVHRTAEASGFIKLSENTLKLVGDNLMKKGDVLAAARIAGITGAKKTWDLIPLCHNILINKVEVDFKINKEGIEISARAICDGKTGIEMEALTAVSIAALTIYDMCKAVDKSMEISDIKLLKKTKE